MTSHGSNEVAKSFVPDVLKSPVRVLRETLRRLFSVTYYRNSVDSSARLNGAILDGYVQVGANTVISGDVRIGKYTTFNDDCLLSGGKIRIGNYCQFGPRAAIYAINHSVRHLTPYNNRILFDGALKELVELGPVEIGHDVWVGHGALIMPNVTLGTGSVVGAGAVVTKSVPPYAIAAGCPAVVKRYRAPEAVAAMLCNSHWWLLDPGELAGFQDVFTEILERVPSQRLQELARRGAAKARAEQKSIG